jgi:hypothetical protein
MEKKFKISLIIGLMITLLIIGGTIYWFLKLLVKTGEEEFLINTREHFEFFECVEVQHGYEICVEKSEFLRNAKVPLKVGKTFIYEVEERRGKGTDKYIVEGIEKIGVTDYYLVRRDFHFIDKSKTIIENTYRAWYSKDTGEVIKIDFVDFNESQIIEGEVAEFIVSDTWNFAPWMLALTDDFEWKWGYKDTYTTGDQIDYKNFQVVGREEVNGRECFKVKRVTVVNSKIDSEEYWWIDVQKRILIQTSTGANLISENL